MLEYTDYMTLYFDAPKAQDNPSNKSIMKLIRETWHHWHFNLFTLDEQISPIKNITLLSNWCNLSINLTYEEVLIIPPYTCKTIVSFIMCKILEAADDLGPVLFMKSLNLVW